jgi:hypothetical protein
MKIQNEIHKTDILGLPSYITSTFLKKFNESLEVREKLEETMRNLKKNITHN